MLRLAAASIGPDEIASMSADEHGELLRDLVRVLQPRLANAPRKGRRRRILATVLLLGDDAIQDRGQGG